MYKTLITIVIPVKDKEETINKFMAGNAKILNNCSVIIIDTDGGEKLRKYGTYLKKDCSMIVARKIGFSLAKTPFILNLDADNILPEYYVEDALDILQQFSNVAVVAIDYETCLGHYGFGTSLWRTEVLKKLYDYEELKEGLCECTYMWRQVLREHLRIETLPYRAVHLKVIKK
jgi:hypothetical protein